MSIAALTDEELIATEPDALKKGLEPVIAKAAGAIGSRFSIASDRMGELERELTPLAEAPVLPKTKGSSALDALARFIPTESITLYVAAVAAMPSLKEAFSWADEVTVYWTFAVLTPILFLLITLGKRRSAGLRVLPSPSKFPWFKLIASTLAFLVWALAVPSSPYLTGEGGKVVAGFGALLVSTFLTLLEPLLSAKTAANP